MVVVVVVVRVWGGRGGGGGGKVNGSEWQKFLAVGKACNAIFCLQVLKGERWSALGSQQTGTVISASVVPHYGSHHILNCRRRIFKM